MWDGGNYGKLKVKMVWEEIWKREGLNWKLPWRGFLVIWQVGIKGGVEKSKGKKFSFFSFSPFPPHPTSPSLSPISLNNHHRTSPPPSSCCQTADRVLAAVRRLLRWVSSIRSPPFLLSFGWISCGMLVIIWGFWMELIWVLFGRGKWLDWE